MCDHDVVQLFREPADKAAWLHWWLNQKGTRVGCRKCRLTGRLREGGQIRWHYAGTIGYEERDRAWAESEEWDHKYPVKE